METWLALIALGVGGVILAVAGLWIYVSATATPLHPDAQAIGSVQETDPAADWTAATESARQIVRTTLSEQNLPGVSVAVGVNGRIVWTEGFGRADIDKHT